jgi:hypothetical protein
MNNPAGSPWLRLWRTRPLQQNDLLFSLLTSVVAVVLGGLILLLGPLALPLIAGLFFVFPWLIQDTFRLFLWLLVTWQGVSLYIGSPIPGISYERSMAALILGLLLLEALVLKRRKLPALGFAVSVYVAAQILSRLTVVGREGLGAFEVTDLLKVVLLPVLMYWITLALVVSRWHLKWLLYTIILASLLICATGLYEWVLGSADSPFPIASRNDAGDTRYMDVPRGRAGGIAENPAIYGAIVGTGLLAALCCLVHTRPRWPLWPTLVLLCIGVFLSFTRSAWIAVLMTVFVTQFYLSGLWKRTLPVFWVAALLLVMLGGALANNAVVQDRLLNEENATGRIERAWYGVELFLERPLLGWGPGELDRLTARRFPSSGFASSHNTFLTILADGGLLVFGSYLAVLIYLAVQIVRVYRAAGPGLERSTVVVAAGGLAIFLISGMALELRHFDYYTALFWVCAGIVEVLRRLYLERGVEAERLREAWFVS